VGSRYRKRQEKRQAVNCLCILKEIKTEKAGEEETANGKG
jgi:hypothetical protein